MKIGEAVYKAQQEAEAAGDAASDAQTDGEDVVDADFEEVSNDDSDEEQKVS
jgi:molecular chaperone DnaK